MIGGPDPRPPMPARSTVGTLSIRRTTTREPIMGRPYHTTDDINHSKSCREAHTRAYGIRKAENIGPVEWIYRGCISMCIDPYHIRITCSIIDLTS